MVRVRKVIFRHFFLYLGASVIITLMCLFVPLSKAQATFFSPGRGIHDNIVGCDKCHQPFKQSYNCTTTGCHPTVGESYKTPASFNFHRLVLNQSCINCHPEHSGKPDQYANNPFDHGLIPDQQINQCQECHDQPKDTLHTNLPSNLPCSACHTTETWGNTKFDHNQLPLSSHDQCIACHTIPNDELHQLVTANCAKCHSTRTWFPAQVNHTELNKRGLVSCGSCHKAPEDLQHQGIGLNCARCHNTNNWQYHKN